MIPPRVSIVKEEKSPSLAEVLEMVKKAVGLLGGMADIVEEGDTVALKPNILTGKRARERPGELRPPD